jgi:short-subunit dehydrogenase
VDLDLVDEVSRVNYLGGVWMTRALLSGLRLPADAGHSHIVNVVSIAGAVAFAPSGAYTAAKHAQLAFSRSLQASLRGSGIDVHTILPGYVETEGFPQRQLLEHPVLRHIVVRPDSVARAIVRVVEHGGREVAVPWFPYRPASMLYGISPVSVSRLGARIVASSRAFQAKAAQSSSGPV